MIPTWAERCEKFGDEIVTNAKIQQVMQEEIDELREALELATWDEDAWKKFKKDNYEVINLGHIEEASEK